MVNSRINSWKHRLLGPESEKRIEDRIALFEAKTGTELVLAIHRSSGPYPAAGLRLAILIQVFLFSLSPLFLTLSRVIETVGLSVAGLVLAFGLGRTHLFEAMFTSHREIRRHVREHSLRFFHLYHVHETAHRSGCFFFISLQEHKFSILVDKSLSQKLPQESLSPTIAWLSQAFAEKKFEAGILGAIDQFEKAFLAVHPEKLQTDPHPLRNSIRWFDPRG